MIEHTFWCEPGGKEGFYVQVHIGTPTLVHEAGAAEEDAYWTCTATLGSLYGQLAPTRGDSSLEALCAAISLALDLIDDIRLKGGRVMFSPDGEDYPLELLAFGICSDRVAKNALMQKVADGST